MENWRLKDIKYSAKGHKNWWVAEHSGYVTHVECEEREFILKFPWQNVLNSYVKEEGLRTAGVSFKYKTNYM